MEPAAEPNFLRGFSYFFKNLSLDFLRTCFLRAGRHCMLIDEREKFSVTRCRPFSGPTSPTSPISALPALYQPYQPYTGPTGPTPALDGHAEQLRLSNFHRNFVGVDQLAREVINSHGSSLTKGCMACISIDQC